MSARSQLNPQFISKNFIELANRAFLSRTLGQIIDDVEYSPYPFSHFTFSNFIEDEEYLRELKNEIDNLDYKKKDSDLYKFQQSQDLKSITTPNIEILKNTIYKDFKDIIQNITHIPLNDIIDLFAAKYDFTDVLLCHDDQSEGRRLAFILYLNPDNWADDYGGQLGLFSLDEQNQPDAISRQISPKWNQLVLFEVSDKSYHQVAEIKVPGKNRLTVSGWLHGTKPLLLHLPSVNFPFELFPPVEFEENSLYDWINPRYLLQSIQGQIQETFETTSEINLTSFLNDDKYADLLKALDSLPDESWELKGPRFKRNYLVIKPSVLGHPPKKLDPGVDPIQSPAAQKSAPGPLEIVRKCAELFSSEAMFLILANMTGLGLHPLAMAPTDGSSTAGNSVADGERSGSSCASSQAGEDGDRTESDKPRKARGSSLRSASGKRGRGVVEEGVDRPTDPTGASGGSGDRSDPHGTTDPHPQESKTVDEGILVDDPPPPGTNPPEDGDDYGTRFQYEICKFRAGDYTLLNDTSNELEQCSLNLNYYLGCEDWNPEFGGETVYIDQEEDDEELLNIKPTANSLALIYKDQGVAHFIKYINHKCTLGKNKRKSFYQLFFNYYESPDTRCD